MSAGQLDDDRRDIAVMGDVDANMLNRMAKRNRGRNPLEVSGDAIAKHNKENNMDSGNKKAGPEAATPDPAATGLEPAYCAQTLPVVSFLQGPVDGGLDSLIDSADAFLEACDRPRDVVDNDLFMAREVRRLNLITDALAELVRDWRAHVLTSSRGENDSTGVVNE